MKPRQMQIWTSEGSRGQYFHVIARTANRVWCLDDEAKRMFVRLLRKTEAFSGCAVVSHCLMDNHFHLVLFVPNREGLEKDLSDEAFWDRLAALYTREEMDAIRMRMMLFHRLNPGPVGLAQEASYRQTFLKRMWDLSEFMKTLLQRFSTWFNKRHNRVGRLWEQRFKSLVIEGRQESLMAVSAYVDLNPVRAGMVEDPKDYRWCGYAEAMAGRREARRGLGHLMPDDVSPSADGLPNWRVVGREYRRVLFGMTGAQEERLAESMVEPRGTDGVLTLAALVRCRVRYFSDGVVIGSKAFVDAFFEAKRAFFGSTRKDGGRKMRGGSWGELRSLRDLRR